MQFIISQFRDAGGYFRAFHDIVRKDTKLQLQAFTKFLIYKSSKCPEVQALDQFSRTKAVLIYLQVIRESHYIVEKS